MATEEQIRQLMASPRVVDAIARVTRKLDTYCIVRPDRAELIIDIIIATMGHDGCGRCGRERYKHGTRHDTCGRFLEAGDPP